MPSLFFTVLPPYSFCNPLNTASAANLFPAPIAIESSAEYLFFSLLNLTAHTLKSPLNTLGKWLGLKLNTTPLLCSGYFNAAAFTSCKLESLKSLNLE